MEQYMSGSDVTGRLGEETEQKGTFGNGKLWIGQHTADQDILVFDPSEGDPAADVITLYSLTQHRMRAFPRATVLQRIHAITDELSFARAKKDYAQRTKLRTAHEKQQAEVLSTRKGRLRDNVLAAHRRYIKRIGLEYQGERETAADHRPGRRTKCHTCGIGLDDFAGAVCVICDGVLCSCGACACKSVSHQN